MLIKCAQGPPVLIIKGAFAGQRGLIRTQYATWASIDLSGAIVFLSTDYFVRVDNAAGAH